MHLSEISVRRPVATAMVYLGVILLGVVSLARLSVDLLPDLSYPKLTVWTTYPDAGPIEIEEFVTKPIEEAASTVPGLRKVRSVSKEGLSLVTLEFHWGVDMDFASLAVREKLDQLRWILPREAGRPSILRLDPRSQPIMALSVSGGDLIQLRELARDVIKRRLEQLKGVALAVVTGGLEREIHVDVNTPLLATYGLTVEQVSAALAAANYSLPGGTIKKGLYRYSLRALGEFQSPEEINDVVVGRGAGGALIRISDIAHVEDSFRERESITRFNGKESIGLLIKKEAGSNTVQVSRRVREVLKQLQKEYPAIHIAIAYDQAEFISNAISNVKQAIVAGGFLAFLVLFFFLHDLRNPLNIGLSMPLSILTAFVLFYFAGVNLNLMSLGGLALGIGMLVDNSIIVLENIFRHREGGRGRTESATLGAKEVAMPVAASTLTTVAVFLPIVYVHGVAGQLFRDQALAVTFSLLASLVVSLTLLPMLASRFLYGGESAKQPEAKEQRSKENVGRALLTRVTKLLRKGTDWVKHACAVLISPAKRVLEPMFKFFDEVLMRFAKAYDTALEWALDHQRGVLFLVLGILLLGGAVALTLPREFMPKVDQGEFIVEVEAPVGATLEATATRVGIVEGWLLKHQDVEAVFTTMGLIEDPLAIFTEEAALNRARMHVRLKRDRKQSTQALIAELRERTSGALATPFRHSGDRFADLAGLNDAKVRVDEGANTLQQILGTSEPAVAVKIQGEDFTVSRRLAEEVKTRLTSIRGLKEIQARWEEGRPEIRITIDRDRAALYGFSAGEVARFIQNSIKGRVATQFKDFDQKIDILVRPRPEDRDEIEDLLNSHLHASRNAVPLREVVRYEYLQGPTEIRREDQARELLLVGAVEGRAVGDVLRDVEARISDVDHPPDYQIVVGGEREELQQSFRSLAYALLLSAALIYMILAAQFESLRHPLIIMLDVPLTTASLALLFFVTRLSLNVITLIGAIVLAGIAVNDSIVKVDFTNQLRRQGMPMREAIIEAGRVRLRPILMTAVTTILGLLPMAIGWGQGAELQRPLAIALIGGLVISTAVTLVVVPVVYGLVEGRR